MGKRDRESDEEEDGVEKYGKPHTFNPTFKGPLHGRSCTDIICLIIFILYFVGMVAVAIIAFMNGDPRRLIYPTDSNGTICGIDESVADRPYLFFFDLTKCSPSSLSCNTPQVCVKKCPTKYFFYISEDIDYIKETLNLTSNDLRDDPICLDGVDPKAVGFDIAQAVQDNQCSQYILNSTDVFYRCLPEIFFHSDINEAFVKGLLEIFKDTIDRDALEKAIEIAAGIGGSAVIIVEDIQSSWHVILIGIVIGSILCFIWCFIMRFVAGIMVWGSILLLNLILGIAAALSIYEYYTFKGTESPDFEFSFDASSYLRYEKTWLIASIVSSLLFLILLLLTLCLCNRIRIAIELIGEASRSVTAFWSTLFWPLIPFLLEVGVIALWAVVAVYLGTAVTDSYALNDLEAVVFDNTTSEGFQNLICGDGIQFVNVSQSSFCMFNSTVNVEYKWLQAYNLFGFLWLLNFIIGFSHMTLAGTFATYYWTFDKKDVPTVALGGSVWRTFRYHLGSIAFGAAIIAIIQFIRIFLEYLEVQLKKGKDNPVVKYVLRCLKCLFWCLEKFMKFINKNAYIMIAIYGKNFCSSAKSAFFLLMRNIIRVAVVNKITDFLLFLGMLMVTAGVVVIAFFFYAFGEQYAISSYIGSTIVQIPDVRYYWVIIIIIGIGTFVVSKLFFGVFDMAVDTLFLCFLEDLERNDGSADRPYFMKKDLLKICGKKNKGSTEEW